MLFQEYYATAIREGWFDPCFYFDLLQSRGTSISDTDLSLFEHYATMGWKHGLSPSIRFSVARYLAEHRDVADSEVDPLYHYLMRGRRDQCKALALLEWPDDVRFAGLDESRCFTQAILSSSRLPVLFLCDGTANAGQDPIRRLIVSLGQAEGVECFVIADGQAMTSGLRGRASEFSLRQLDRSGWSRDQKADYLAHALAARGDLVVVSGSLATADLLTPFAARGHRTASFLHQLPAREDLAGEAVSGIAQCAQRIVVASQSVRDRISAAGAIARDDIQVLPPPAGNGEAWTRYVEDTGQCLRGLGNDGRRIRLTGRTLGRQEIADDLCVVVPSYNHKPFIVAAIDSILAQSVRPREIRIIDDGSTDGSADLVCSLASARLGIFAEARENRGAQATINQAIAETECPIVAVMNSDDVWHPLRIEELIGSLRGGGADVVFSRVRVIGPQDRCKVKRKWYERGVADYNGGSPLWLALMFCNFFFTTSNLIARRDKLLEVGGFGPLRYCHDLDYMLTAIFAGHKVRFVQQTLCDYRIHGRNTIDENVGEVLFEEAWIIVKHLRQNAGKISEFEKSMIAQRACDKGLATRVQQLLRLAAGNADLYDDKLTYTAPQFAAILEYDNEQSPVEPEQLLHEMARLGLAHGAEASPAARSR